MTAEEAKQLVLMYLPAILAVLAALGVWKALAGVAGDRRRTYRHMHLR